MIKFFSLILIFIFTQFSFAQEKSSETSAEANSKKFRLTEDEVDSSRFYGKAILQILDKTTAKSSIIEVAIGGEAMFARIKIKVRKCWQAPLDQKPDSRILVEVFEKKSPSLFEEKTDKKEEEKRIFFGWLIASSPSISSLEHPVYDIVAINCKK